MPKLINGARTAITSHAVSNDQQSAQNSINGLVAELQNSPRHMFGKHDKCGSFCEMKLLDPDLSVYTDMHSSGLLQAIEDEIT